MINKNIKMKYYVNQYIIQYYVYCIIYWFEIIKKIKVICILNNCKY